MEFIYLSLAVYLVLILAIAYLFTDRRDDEDYLIAKRDRKTYQIALSKFAGSIGVGWFITYTAYAYEFGFGVFGLLLGTIIGYSIYGLWAAPRLHKESKTQKFYTQGDYVYSKLKSNFAKKATNYISSFIIFIWLLIGVVGGSKIISEFGLLSYELSLILMCFFVLVYVLVSGFKGVIITDIIQSILIFVLLTAVTYFIVGNFGSYELFSADVKSVSIVETIALLIFGVLSVYSGNNYYQLVFASKDSKSARKGFLIAFLPIIVCAFFLLLIGLFIKLQGVVADPALIFPIAMKQFLPEVFLPVALIMFLAGVMSSADTNVYAISSHLVFSHTKKMVKKYIRISSALVMILCFLIGYFFRDIIDLTIFAAASSILLSLPMIYLISNGKSKKVFIWSFSLSILGLILGLMVFGLVAELLIMVLIPSLIPLIVKGISNINKKFTSKN